MAMSERAGETEAKPGRKPRAARQPKKQPKPPLYTYEEFMALGEEYRGCEFVDGVIIHQGRPVTIGEFTEHNMAPSAGSFHQGVQMSLSRLFSNYLLGRTCKVYADLDIRLKTDNKKGRTLRPDLIVVCDRSKITPQCCDGAPDLVIEILSPSTNSYDRVVKFNHYLEAGVREYWLVDPESKTVQTYTLKNGEYVGAAYDETGNVKVSVLEGCVINLQEVFAE